MSSRRVTVAVLLGLYLGCESEPEAEPPPDDACEQIIAACHPKDDATPGELNDCHNTGHLAVAADCQAVYTECIAICDAAPTVDADTGDMDDGGGPGGTTDGGSDDHDHDDGDHGTSDDGATGTEDGDGSDGSSSATSSGTTGGDESTGDDGTADASCAELGSGCHDTQTPLGVMCHDVGHDGDEAACAEVWVECKEHCGF